MSWLLAANEIDPLALVYVISAVVVLFVLLIIVAVFANYFRLWLQSFLTGAGITIWDLIGMTFRKVNKDVIVKSKIMAVQAGLDEDQGITSKVLEAVQTSVYPKVIDCPARGSGTLDAVARNGIQLKVRARVTVRANLQR